MAQRNQRTIRREVTSQGIGFVTGADLHLRFRPAPPNHGIVFQRIDLPGQPLIPARLENLIPRSRRTGIAANGASVELVEHVLAALAGLQIDNCLVQVDGPEMPGFDGSCRPVVQCLLDGDIEEQPALRPVLSVGEPQQLSADDGSLIKAQPSTQPGLTISYLLDYGPRSPIWPQSYTVNVTPETFILEIAFARTFVLESEVAALQAQGIGKRSTARDLLIFGSHGVVDNKLRANDECARHKLLDCIGDFALCGCDIDGYFHAWRTGHRQNHEIIRKVRDSALLSADGKAA